MQDVKIPYLCGGRCKVGGGLKAIGGTLLLHLLLLELDLLPRPRLGVEVRWCVDTGCVVLHRS